MAGKILPLDLQYEYRPEWAPAGCDIRPWFLLDAAGRKPFDTAWKACLAYRAEKLEFVRGQLAGVDRAATLQQWVRDICAGAATERARFEKLVFFVERTMLHPPIEQPVEPDAFQTFRRECSPPVTQAPAYPEDLEIPWLAKAYEEARAFGCHLGVWCNPFEVHLTGDWGMRGVVHDALELLLLHEGRCGHQACVMVQLAQAAGLRARLVQVNHHRVAELLVDGAWRLADPDVWSPGALGTDEQGQLVDVLWCYRHPDRVRRWPIRTSIITPDQYAAYFQRNRFVR
ncbi:MAG: hypothetical protein HY343_10690 [Lentisphaerae bacterium]|nr:hypothetical protein [Lentisphaerota bacterium]